MSASASRWKRRSTLVVTSNLPNDLLDRTHLDGSEAFCRGAKTQRIAVPAPLAVIGYGGGYISIRCKKLTISRHCDIRSRPRRSFRSGSIRGRSRAEGTSAFTVKREMAGLCRIARRDRRAAPTQSAWPVALVKILRLHFDLVDVAVESKNSRPGNRLGGKSRRLGPAPLPA